MVFADNLGMALDTLQGMVMDKLLDMEPDNILHLLHLLTHPLSVRLTLLLQSFQGKIRLPMNYHHPSPIRLRDDDGDHSDCVLHDDSDITIHYFLYNSCFSAPFRFFHFHMR